MAQQPAHATAFIGEISQAQDLPESYLAKILQDLAKSGLVVSHRGAGGGFSLARDPGQITLREVIEAIDGPIALNRCLDPRKGCERLESCPLYPVLAEAQAKMVEVLERTTIQSLVT